MYELDFFGMISSGGIEWMAWITAVISFFFILMGLMWPWMEKLFLRWEVEELMEAVAEIDVELLEKIGKEIDILARQENALLWHINPSRGPDWISMAWNGLEPIVRKREMLEEQVTYIWMTPIILT